MPTLWLSLLALATAGTITAGVVPSRRHAETNCHPHQCPGGPRALPPRQKVCVVASKENGQDDAQNILDAIHECNNGGRVVFKEGVQYTIGTALDLTFMNDIDLDIQGHIQFTDDTSYWQENSFQFVFQNATSFWLWGGHGVAVYGGGTIDGNGQAWYDLYAENPLVNRPTLIGIEGLHNAVITDLNLRQSPTYHFFMANSSEVYIADMSLISLSSNANPNANTDGIDTYRSDNVALQNWVVNNGDDCVSFKPNSTNMLVQNFHCNGSHGISVGSLGQYVGTYSIVQNVLVYNVEMTDCLTGARVKVWPDTPSTEAADLSGGGGDGLVSNVVFDTFTVNNVDYAIEVDQCYGQSNLTLCYDNPSPLKITNVSFKNFKGTTDSKYAPDIATFACSSSTACSNIQVTDFHVQGPDGSLAYCNNVDNSLLTGVNCTGPYKGFE